jgi:glycosyltransferase involved in cell wall biosynthesis
VRILVVSSLYSPFTVGGAERVAQALAEKMAARGHEVRVTTTAPTGAPSGETINDVHIRYVRVRNLYPLDPKRRRNALLRLPWHVVDSSNPFMERLVASEIAKWDPDIVHTHNPTGFSPAVWRAAAKLNVPVVHTLHDYYLLCPTSTMYRNDADCSRGERCVRCKIVSFPRKHLSRYLNAVVGVSNSVLARHDSAGLFAEHTKRYVIYNQWPRPQAHAHLESRASPADLPAFGFLGQITPPKGVESLLRAWAAIPGLRGKLWIAGTGRADYLSHLRALAPGPDVHWLGFVSPSELFHRIDVLVVPSQWQDPAPLVVGEAMAHGIPVLGANRGGIPELIGDAGWLFDGTTAALSDALQRLARDCVGIRQKAIQAHRRALLFSSERQIGDYEALYAQLKAPSRNRLHQVPPAIDP